MISNVLIGIGAGASFFISAFSLGKWSMRRAWKKNELELRGIQKDLIELQSIDPDNEKVNEVLKELDQYFLEFYSEDHFEWTWKKGKEELSENKNV